MRLLSSERTVSDCYAFCVYNWLEFRGGGGGGGVFISCVLIFVIKAQSNILHDRVR